MNKNESESQMMLTSETILDNRYCVQKVLGIGGFGITYLARDEHTMKEIAIKEYFPFTLANRDIESGTVYAMSSKYQDVYQHGIKVFQQEAQTLTKFLGDAGIVQVMDYFHENGTVYYTMEYLDGVNLKNLILSMKGQVPIDFGMEILFSIAITLERVHKQGLFHRDITPENIFITKSGQIKLIDFGSTRNIIGEKSRSLSVVLKPGYAPPEQYSTKGCQGPWTDIYGLCATIYLALTGITIPDGPSRLKGEIVIPLEQLVPEIDRKVSRAILRGLCLDYRQRYQTINDFMKDIEEHSNIEVRKVPTIKLVQNNLVCDSWMIPINTAITIGRSTEKCNVVVNDPNVSRVHCSLLFESESNLFYLTDLSRNGTFINKMKLETGKIYKLEPGESFYIIEGMCLRVEVQ